MNTPATLRVHLRNDTDEQLSKYLDELNAAELAAPSVPDRIWAREAAMVVAHVLVNRKAAALLKSRKEASCA